MNRLGDLRQRRLATLASLLFVASTAGACVTAATTLPASTSGPSASPGAPAGAAATPTPSPTPSPAPSVPAMPAGKWTTFRWTRMPLADLHLPFSIEGDNDWSILGWSGGWLAFADQPNPSGGDNPQIATFHSKDGTTWAAGKVIPGRDQADAAFLGLVEGPQGILLYDHEGVVCGDVPHVDTPVAVSSDGASWVPVNLAQFGDGGGFQTMSGGSSGYIGAGVDGVWTSNDGLSWRKAPLSGTAFKGLDGIDDGVAISGGFVISGETYGPADEGCGGAPKPLTPSVWWSPDGQTWTRQALPGAKPGAEQTVSLLRLDDNLVVATAADGSWSSTDGRTWKAVSFKWDAADGDAMTEDTVFLRGQSLFVSTSESGAVVVTVLRDDLSVEALKQSGDPPDSAHIYSWPPFGPTGVIALADNGFAYLGVPIAGS